LAPTRGCSTLATGAIGQPRSRLLQRLQAQRRATFARGPFNAREHIIKTADLHPADGQLDAVLVIFPRACSKSSMQRDFFGCTWSPQVTRFDLFALGRR
jgi:hypothetical protein